MQKVREEINRFLEDDSDMRDMYLTRKAQARSAAAGLLGAFGDAAAGGAGGGGGGEAPEPPPLYDPMDDDADIQQLEDLLETYFTQVDNSFNKLQARLPPAPAPPAAAPGARPRFACTAVASRGCTPRCRGPVQPCRGPRCSGRGRAAAGGAGRRCWSST